MTFELGEYRVIAPLDPSEGERFVEPTCLDLEEINHLYKTTREKRIMLTQLQMGYLVEKHHIM
jgi:hypothetical protein